MQALPWGEDKKKPTPRHAKQAPSIICTQYAAAFSILVVVVLAAVAAAVVVEVILIRHLQYLLKTFFFSYSLSMAELHTFYSIK